MLYRRDGFKGFLSPSKSIAVQLRSLLGPPSPEFVASCKGETLPDERGVGNIDIATASKGLGRELEMHAWESGMGKREPRMDDTDEAKFFRFIRRIMKWDPAKRPTAHELLNDPWLVCEEIADEFNNDTEIAICKAIEGAKAYELAQEAPRLPVAGSNVPH